MIKNGSQHRESLRDGREIFLDGASVADATAHPAYRNSIDSVCRLYDHQCDPRHRAVMTYEVEGSGEIANRMWQLPRNYAELVARRQALESWATTHGGFFGRSPDHVGSCIAGMVMGLDVFEAWDPARAKALADYYAYARDNDVFLSYVIINPQADRSRSAGEQADPYLTAAIVDENAEGITVRGAKMLGTAAIMANEILVTSIQPLKPGEERYALSFAIPLNARGLKILSRKSYEQSAASRFDNPLSSRYDENDALVYFDDVRVPWERIFIAGNTEMCLKQFHATPSHVYQNYQAQVRLMVKLRFMAGIAHRIATMNGIIDFPQVSESLGQIAAQAGMVEGLVAAMEAKGRQIGPYYVPDRHTLYTAQVLTQQLYPQIVTAIRELAGGAMIALPSSIADFANAELRGLIERTQQSAAADARSKVKFYKLAWDAVGSEYGSRHTQYEMFYAGATFVTKGHAFRSYDWDRALGLVDGFLDDYTLEDELADIAGADSGHALAG